MIEIDQGGGRRRGGIAAVSRHEIIIIKDHCSYCPDEESKQDDDHRLTNWAHCAMPQAPVHNSSIDPGGGNLGVVKPEGDLIPIFVESSARGRPVACWRRALIGTISAGSTRECSPVSLDLLIACWKERRIVLSSQLELMEHDETRTIADGIDIRQQDIARLKSQIAELDELLAKYKH